MDATDASLSVGEPEQVWAAEAPTLPPTKMAILELDVHHGQSPSSDEEQVRRGGVDGVAGVTPTAVFRVHTHSPRFAVSVSRFSEQGRILTCNRTGRKAGR